MTAGRGRGRKVLAVEPVDRLQAVAERGLVLWSGVRGPLLADGGGRRWVASGGSSDNVIMAGPPGRLGLLGGTWRTTHRRVEPMALGWSRSHGWRSYDAWKRWYRQEWGRVDPPPPQSPSRKLAGVYRVFSASEGVQAEVEVAAVEPGTTAASEREVRQRVRLSWWSCRNTSPAIPTTGAGPRWSCRSAWRLLVGRCCRGVRSPRRRQRRDGRWVSLSRWRWTTWEGESVAGRSRRITSASG